MQTTKTNWLRAGLCLLLAGSISTVFAEEETTEAEVLPKNLKVISLAIYPDQVKLGSLFAYRQVLLTGTLKTGESVDLTRMASVESNASIVRVSENGLVRPVTNGTDELTFRFEKFKVRLPVEVTNLEVARPVSFVQDVQPTLSKLGCNAGTCHGSRVGKNGFKLSLRGYDPLYDHRALTDDVGSRRFNRAAPDQSLMLLKSTGTIPHVGGAQTKIGSTHYQLLRGWISSGAKLDLESPRVSSIEVLPVNPVVPRAGMKQQMSVLATYADGSVRDVTAEAFIESGDIEIIDAAKSGLLTVLRRGEAPVLVRYEGAYAATRLTVMGDRSGFSWKEPEHYNYVDSHVYAKLQQVKVLPSDLSTDESFIRRIFIDLTGLPPTVEQIRSFLENEQPSREKRTELIDSLVGSKEYVEHWTNKWADLLQVNRKFLGEEGSIALRNWIKHSVATNKPYDQMAREVITASGSTIDNPPAAYYKVLRDPASLMENTTHLFLAVRFNCNKCHDHPFERWTQDQYYYLAAYFAQIGRKEDPAFAGKKIGGTAVEGAKPLVEVIFDSGSGEVTHDRTGEITPPSFPYEHDDELPDSASRRDQLAHWITSPENQYFARSYVNRLWGYLFGPGIIEPIDDIRAGNPPSNPELLDALTKDFLDSGFDVQHMMRVICNSRTYQHSVSVNEWNTDDVINYSHSLPRRLPAEVLFDAIHLATGSQLKIPGVPAGFRAAELPDAGIKVPFLDDFGRPARESACECDRTTGMVLGPVMKLVNGPTVANAIADPANALTRLESEIKDDKQLIDEIFLRFLARYPTPQEQELGISALNETGSDLEKLKKQLADYEQGVPERQATWEKNMLAETAWQAVEYTELTASNGATLTAADDGSILVTGANGKGTYNLKLKSPLEKITGLRLEAMNDKSLSAGGPGRAKNGNFVLGELTATSASLADLEKSSPVKLQNATASFSQAGYAITSAIDGNLSTGWAVAPQFNKIHTAIIETAMDVVGEGGSQLTLTMNFQFDDTHLLGKFRIAVTGSPRPLKLQSVPADLAALLAVPAAERNDEQKAVLLEKYKATDKEWQNLQATVASAEELLKNKRLIGLQDLAWALINNPSFLFNR